MQSNVRAALAKTLKSISSASKAPNGPSPALRLVRTGDEPTNESPREQRRRLQRMAREGTDPNAGKQVQGVDLSVLFPLHPNSSGSHEPALEAEHEGEERAELLDGASLEALGQIHDEGVTSPSVAAEFVKLFSSVAQKRSQIVRLFGARGYESSLHGQRKSSRFKKGTLVDDEIG